MQVTWLRPDQRGTGNAPADRVSPWILVTRASRPTRSMAADERTFSELAELSHSGNADKDALLAELGLNGVPTRDEILADLEDRYLTPKDVLPTHWLDTYQVSVCEF